MGARARRRARVLTPAAAEGLVRPYDFAKPEPLTKPQREVLEAAFETFARQLGMQITASTRTVSSVLPSRA